MGEFVKIGYRGQYTFGYEDIIEQPSGSTRREYQVRGTQDQIVRAADDERKIQRDLADLLANERVEVEADKLQRSSGWGILVIQIQDGNGRVIDTYYVLVEPSGSRRPGQFTTLNDADAQLKQILALQNHLRPRGPSLR